MRDVAALPDRATRIMLANGLMMSALLTVLTIDYRLAQLLVTATLLCTTFGINSAWTFRATKAR
jgi:putative flippase GtrA